MEVFARNMVRMVLRKARKNGYNQKHMILVGYSRAAEQYIDRILANPEWGYAVRGILDDHQPRGMEYKGIKVIGSIDNLLVILPQNQIDEIAITLGLDEYHKLEYIVNMCENQVCIQSLFRIITISFRQTIYRRYSGTSCDQHPSCTT